MYLYYHLFILVHSVYCSISSAASDFLISSLPEAPFPLPEMHSGYVPIGHASSQSLFFWHIQASERVHRQNTVIWFNGGPGCSSMIGAFLEIGPYRIQLDGKLMPNEGSWSQYANLLFIDNPIGSGFSFADEGQYITELQQMSEQVVSFLENLFEVLPEYVQTNIYLSGESFAGQYIPYIAREILERNKAAGQNEWDLAGLLIGNGWIDGTSQYPSYLEYALRHGMINDVDLASSTAFPAQKACIDDLGKTDMHHVRSDVCSSLLGELLNMTRRDNQCFNMYDVRRFDEFPRCGLEYPPELESLATYLQREDVMTALHVDPSSGVWTECNTHVAHTFSTPNSTSSVQLLPDLLTKTSILLYSGDKDFACNHIGTERLIDGLTWAGSQGFHTDLRSYTPQESWIFEGQEAGLWRTARNLSYVRFFNASHMVPFDYPNRSAHMLHHFISMTTANVLAMNDSRDGSAVTHPVSNETHDLYDFDHDHIENGAWCFSYYGNDSEACFFTSLTILFGFMIVLLAVLSISLFVTKIL